VPARLQLPESFARWVAPRPWLTVSVADAAALEFRGWRYPLSLRPLPPLDAKELQEFAQTLSQQAGAIVVRAVIPGRVRAVLEENDVGYLDSRGNLHIVAPTGILHAEGARPARRLISSGLGVNGVRAVQELLSRTDAFTLSDLASDVSLSLAQTHSVLVLLENNGFIRATGAGPTRRRTVVDRAQLLDWLQVQSAARRPERRLEATLYARRPEDVWTRAGEALARASIPYALTGGAAASLWGCGPTSVVTSALRIDPDVSLEDAAQVLGATVTDRGPNVRLMRDTGRVGSMKAEEKGGVRLAPRVRVYLDVLGERRGEDVARQFRETILGY
jgi:hypothetical protein